MADHEITAADAVIDNGKFGTRTIRFETGKLARQAAGSAVAYFGDSMLLSATTASKAPKSAGEIMVSCPIRTTLARPATSKTPAAPPKTILMIRSKITSGFLKFAGTILDRRPFRNA